MNTPAASGIPITLYINAQKRFSWIFLKVALPSFIAAGTSARLLFISTTSAASIATSVPAPIAIPTSAFVRAGASLIPSPTIAVLPSNFNFSMMLAFPSGKTPAITSSTPACLPIASAVFWLSPVSITTFSPIFFRVLIAFGLSSLITSATAIIPAKVLFLQKNKGVFPSSDNLSADILKFSGIFATEEI